MRDVCVRLLRIGGPRENAIQVLVGWYDETLLHLINDVDEEAAAGTLATAGANRSPGMPGAESKPPRPEPSPDAVIHETIQHIDRQIAKARAEAFEECAAQTEKARLDAAKKMRDFIAAEGGAVDHGRALSDAAIARIIGADGQEGGGRNPGSRTADVAGGEEASRREDAPAELIADRLLAEMSVVVVHRETDMTEMKGR